MRAENGFSMLVCAATAVLLGCQSQAAPADVISRSPAEAGEVCSDLLLGMSRIDGSVSVKVKAREAEDGCIKWQTWMQGN